MLLIMLIFYPAVHKEKGQNAKCSLVPGGYGLLRMASLLESLAQ